MEILKIFLIGLLATILVMFGLQVFARWRIKKILGKEIPKRFGKNSVLYFYSPGCGACVKMNPIIETLSKRVNVKKIDISKGDGLQVAREFGILGTPTTLIVRDGRVKNIFLGFQKEDKILKEVEE